MSFRGEATVGPWRAVAALGAPLALATAGLPLVAGAAWAAVVPGVGLAGFLDARAVQAWAVALGVAAALGAVRGFALRSHAYALACASLLAACAQLAVQRAVRLEGAVLAGVAEPDPPWRHAESGPLAARPAVEVVDVGGGRAHLRVDGLAAELAPGGSARLGPWVVRVVSISAAPEFEIARPGGTIEGAGLFKLGGDPDAFLEVGALPHRFHLARAAADGAPDVASAPARLRLRVFRGKLRVFDGFATKGEPVSFDGLGFRYGDGGAWVEVVVRRAVPWHLAAAAAALAVAAAVAASRRRPRRA